MDSTQTTYVNNGGFVIDYNNDTITIPETGTYRLSYCFNYTSTSGDLVIPSIVFYNNGAELVGTESRGAYMRFSGWLGSNSTSTILNFTAGDVLDVYCRFHRYGSSYYFQINGGASYINLELIS